MESPDIIVILKIKRQLYICLVFNIKQINLNLHKAVAYFNT